MSSTYDVAICGAGPAGAVCAIAAARDGWNTALLERVPFPRHKVCGDCLNPSVWPVLESLEVAGRIQALASAALEQVRFVSRSGTIVEVPLPAGAERAVMRSLLDQALLEEAIQAGVTLISGSPLTALHFDNGQWIATTAAAQLRAKVFIAADGRNSTSCRLLGLSAPVRQGRVALQCHAPLARAYQGTVALELLPHGYCGVSPVDGEQMNICMVSKTDRLADTKATVHDRLHLPQDQPWRSLAPIDRGDLPPAPHPACFLAGDAARVVEPFTGEGIYYALQSGKLAAAAASRYLSGSDDSAAQYRTAHAGLYRNRLWINKLARLAVIHPQLGDFLLGTGRHFPRLLEKLTAKVVTSPALPTARQKRF